MDDTDRKPGTPSGTGKAPPAAEETNPGGSLASEASRGRDERAAGRVDDPIAAGDGFGSNDYQVGDRSELAQQRGGPVDVSRDRPKRGGRR